MSKASAYSDRDTTVALLMDIMLMQICIAFALPVVALGQVPYASHKPLREPTIFGEGTISGGDFDSHPAFTPDGRTIYFVRSSPNFGFWTIFVSKFENGDWTQPEVAPFSGQYSDADPFIAADEKQFYFISKRPVNGRAKTDNDIWMMNKTETGWSEPQHLDTPVNSDVDEWYPTLSRDGTIYFGSDRPGGRGKTDLYRARLVKGKYATAENLGEPINTAADEYEPFIAPDESFLIFMAGGRPDALGRGDLYVSHRQGEKWSEPQNLGNKINSSSTEYSPKISPDGKYFFWSSTRGLTEAPMEKRLDASAITEKFRSARNGLGDIYQIDTAELHLEGKREGETTARSSQDALKSTQVAVDQAGSHDFDFEIGTWKTHLWTLRHPLTDSTEWVQSKGTVVVRKVWNGRANLVELVAEGPAGHLEFLNLRLYNPQTHQWSDYFANSRDSTLLKPMIGEFKNGRGEFFFHEKLNGRAMFFRSVISDITPNSCRFENAFSDDGGKTWKVKDIAIDTRVKDESAQDNSGASNPTLKHTPSEHDGQHDFDFEIGTWKTHLWRLLDPLTGSTKWVEYEGTSMVRSIWSGRANLVELVADGPAGHFEGLNLRLYNPKSRQWSLNFASSKGGTLSPPTTGEFKNGRGEFFSQETLNGRVILVRFVISDVTPDSCRFEQAFSDDGGKTWEVNWIAVDTRVKG